MAGESLQPSPNLPLPYPLPLDSPRPVSSKGARLAGFPAPVPPAGLDLREERAPWSQQAYVWGSPSIHAMPQFIWQLLYAFRPGSCAWTCPYAVYLCLPENTGDEGIMEVE